MAERLQKATTSGKPVLLRIAPGSRGGIEAMRAEHEEELADIYSFALWQLGDRDFQRGPPRPPLAPAGEPPRPPPKG